MMDALQITYALRVEDTEDFWGDEPRLEFIFVTTHQNRVQTYVQDSGQLASNFNGGFFASGTKTITGLEVVSPLLPYAGSTFFGFGVRAVENDNTSFADRRQARRDLARGVEDALRPVVDAGGVPNVGQLWSGINAAPMPTAGDEDDRIGVSARVYPDLFSQFGNDPDGTHLMSDAFAFSEDGAHWEMPWRMTQYRL